MTEGGAYRIVHLVDAPQAAPTLARWFVEAWAPYYGPGGPGDAEGDLAACRGRGALPICLVVLCHRADEVIHPLGGKRDRAPRLMARKPRARMRPPGA